MPSVIIFPPPPTKLLSVCICEALVKHLHM